MLNTHKLLYILPDLAYLAELLPGKKPNTFTIQNFKQFNGKLIKGNKLDQENIAKLLGRLDEGEYDVVLPDDIFANTIVDIEESTEAEVKKHLKEEIIPSLHIDGESHLIETFILSEYKGTYKVQLSTIQKSLLSPLKQAVEGTKVKIAKIYSLSWTIKSLISLEPSISLVQMGNNLLLAKHYIGVDQPVMDTIDNLDRFVEVIKTLKGAEPSIQTIYLLSNELVEEKLKKELNDVLPIQQIAEGSDKDAKLPSYVEKAITAAMMTISIKDFIMPEFNLTKVEVGEVVATKTAADSKALVTEVQDSSEAKPEAVLPKPGSKPEKTEVKAEKEPETEMETEDLDAKDEVETKKEPVVEEADKEAAEVAASVAAEAVTEVSAAKVVAAAVKETEKKEAIKPKKKAEVVSEPETETADDEVDLSQFIDHSDEVETKTEKKKEFEPAVAAKDTKMKKKPEKKVLKNNDGIGNFVKVFLIGLASFAITVGIGVGIGFGVLKLSGPDVEEVESPVSEEASEATTAAEVQPEPTEVPAEINREEFSIKVVNATTQAGYASEIATQLEVAGFTSVTAKNAAGDYESGYYLLMVEENQALLDTIATDLDLELSYSAETEFEDPTGEFDAVVVLSQ